MKRRLVSGLLAASMILSLMPVSALAEGDGAAPADTTAVVAQVPESDTSERNAELDEVVGIANYVLEKGELAPAGDNPAEQAIDQAQQSEAVAALDAVVSGELDAAKAEVDAIVKQEQAQEDLDAAEDVIAEAESEIEEKADAAEKAAEDAAKAKDEAADNKNAADQAAQKADQALEDAKQAGSVVEANQAAVDAEKQSDAAASAAADAVIKSDEAAQKATDAETAYNDAKAAADAADAKAQELLKDGVEQMDEAQKAAAEAQKLAEEKYQEMVAAKDAADAAAATAKQEADAAKAELDDAKAALEKTIEEQGKNVAEKGAVVAATGTALVATKAAVEVAKVVVEHYEGEITKLQQQIDELEGAVEEAQAAIDEAQAKLDALDEKDAAYPQAKAELEKAIAAQEQVQAVYNNAQAIIDAKKAAQEDGTEDKSSTADTMKSLQDKVSDGTATDAEKQQLTELVLESINTYDKDVKFDEIKWVEDHDDIFYIEDEEGNRTYYKVDTDTREDGTTYLQYCGATYVPEAEVPNLLKETEYAVEGETRYKAYIGEQEYDVSIVKSTVLLKDVYQYKVDGHKLTYDPITDKYSYTYKEGRFYKTVYVTLKDPARFDSDNNPISTNSNTITEMWEQAEDAEKNLTKAENKLQTAQEEFDKAEKQYNETKAALEQIIAVNEADKKDAQDQIDVLEEEKEDKEHTLNGGLGDQLLRAMIKGNPSEVEQGVTDEIKDLGLKIFSGELTVEEAKKEIAELKQALADSKEVYDSLTGILDGEITQDDVQSIAGLIQDNSLSIKTQQALAEKLEGLLEKQFENATENLQDAVDTAKEEIGKQTETAGKAALNAAEKEVALAQAQLKQGLATQGANQAEKLLASAEQAAKDAQAAYEAYVALASSLNVDRAAVDAAKEAYEQAQQDAVAAKKLADQALLDAENAKAAAEAARKLADEYPVPTEGEEIADYVQSFLGRSDSQLTNPAFVEQVFQQYGYTISLNSRQVEDVLRVGTQVENSEADPGDLICILAEDGTILLFGVYHGNGIYSFFNELTGKVEIGRCADALHGWIVIRIVN